MDIDVQGQDAIDVHKPFTKAERIQQLAEIDNDITLLLTHTGKAIQSLAQPTTPDNADGDSASAPDASTSTANPAEPGAAAAPPPALDPEERLESFKAAMNAFMSALHSVDVRLKRQIWGLEEAGIVTLRGADRREQVAEGGGAGSAGPGGGPAGAGGVGGSAGGPGKGSLEPNGVGNMGVLDVGWLNARSNKVERVMESELWAGARQHLEGIVEGRIRTGGSGVGLGLADSGPSGGDDMEG